jgi:hypothetical protein
VIKTVVVPVLAALCVSMPAMANESSFAALEGVQAQELTSAEMSAIQGQLALVDVVTAINNSTKLTSVQKTALVKYVTFWWNWLSANKAWFDKLMARI